MVRLTGCASRVLTVLPFLRPFSIQNAAATGQSRLANPLTRHAPTSTIPMFWKQNLPALPDPLLCPISCPLVPKNSNEGNWSRTTKSYERYDAHGAALKLRPGFALDPTTGPLNPDS